MPLEVQAARRCCDRRLSSCSTPTGPLPPLPPLPTCSFIQASGVKALSRRADGRSPIAGGGDTEALEEALDAARRGSSWQRPHDAPGLVSLAVRPLREPSSKEKLVAVGGKLVNVTETFGEVGRDRATRLRRPALPAGGCCSLGRLHAACPAPGAQRLCFCDHFGACT